MHYCVREDRTDMCPTFKNKIRCSRYGESYILFEDSICRPETSNPPSQIVCPIGNVLCPDLTCREYHDQCQQSEYLPSGKIRCVDQTIVSDVKDCPSTKTCNNISHVVCMNDCVENEFQCYKKKCPNGFLCFNNVCAQNSEQCNKNEACGQGKSLCEDGICRNIC